MITEDGFTISSYCSCNNCELMCDAEGYLYESTGVFEGFSGTTVLISWIAVLIIAIGITVYRKSKSGDDNGSLIDPI